MLITGKKGWLPENFSLHGDNPVYEPGELEGKLLYCDDFTGYQENEPRPEVFEKFMRLLRNAYEDPKKRKGQDLIRYFEEIHVIWIIDKASDEICNNRRGIDLIKLLEISYEWVISSESPELVKLGIALMGMMNLNGWEECKEAIVTLGKYSEFTFYSLYAISGWQNAEVIARDYAANLKGWGKRHADEWLSCEA